MIPRLKALAVASLLLFAFAGTSLHAQQTQTSNAHTLSYQGVLKTTAGNISAATRLLTVTLYGDANGNTKLWQNTMNTPVDANGVFNCMLGTPDNPLPGPAAMDRPIWLGVAVDNGPELRPLSEVTASAYALNVADNAITTAKLADNAVTASKLNTDYVSSISVNGQKVTGQASNLNIVGGDGVDLAYDNASNSLVLNTSGSATNTDGKGASAENATTEWQLVGNTLGAGGGQLGSLSGSIPIGWSEIVQGATVQQFQFDPSWPSGAQPDIIGGFSGNFIHETSSTMGGNFIGGGGGGTLGEPNQINTAHFATIGGGLGNSINFEDAMDSADFLKFQVIGGGEKNHALRKYSAILGGDRNRAFGEWSVIGGGHVNLVDSLTEWSVICGGDTNIIRDWSSFIGGGLTNTISTGNFSVISGGRHSSISNANGTIAGGDTNSVSDTHGTIGGGLRNSTSGNGYSTVGGGRYNSISGSYGTIAGGDTNSINISGETGHSNYDAIGGGQANKITNSDTSAVAGGANNSIEAIAPSSFIGGGTSNTIFSSQGSTVGGGNTNYIGAPTNMVNFAFIGGGQLNLISGGQAPVIGGGDSNLVIGDKNTITGGGRNTTSSSFSHIGGGDTNYIYEFPYSVIGGGEYNHILPAYDLTGLDHSFIGGGYQNTVLNGMAGIGGGDNNTIDTFADHSFIGGGRQNLIQGPFCVITGGESNNIYNGAADHNAIGGGLNNVEQNPSYGTIGGGAYNLIDTAAWGSVIGGGYKNTNQAVLSFIGGGNNNVIHVLTEGNSTITGGDSNSTFGPREFIGGGDNNYTWGNNAALVGGTRDTVRADHGFLGAGFNNKIDWTADTAVLVGGGENYIGDSSICSFIGGGVNDTLLSMYGTLSGGHNNKITNTARYATIPGGDSLIANSFAQTVVGYNNIQTGTVPQGTPHAHNDSLLFIVGNGDKSTLAGRSDAFAATIGGGSRVFENRGSGGATSPPGNPDIYGTSYQDNGIVGWGEVQGTTIPGPLKFTPIDDFGVGQIINPAQGQYVVTLNMKNPDGSARSLATGSVTATLVANLTAGVCNKTISVSPISGGSFTVWILDNTLSCATAGSNNAFTFQVVGR